MEIIKSKMEEELTVSKLTEQKMSCLVLFKMFDRTTKTLCDCADCLCQKDKLCRQVAFPMSVSDPLFFVSLYKIRPLAGLFLLLVNVKGVSASYTLFLANKGALNL